MGPSEKSFNQVRSILGKLDRSIDEARQKRTQVVAPPPPPKPIQMPQAPMPMQQPQPRQATMNPARPSPGRATPIPSSNPGHIHRRPA